MNVRQLQKINVGFGYHVGARTREVKNAIFLNSIKVAMYVPVINLIAIGIIASMAKGDLFKRSEGRLILARMVISVIAAPVLLPIDIIATVAIQVLLNRMNRRAVI